MSDIRRVIPYLKAIFNRLTIGKDIEILGQHSSQHSYFHIFASASMAYIFPLNHYRKEEIITVAFQPQRTKIKYPT